MQFLNLYAETGVADCRVQSSTGSEPSSERAGGTSVCICVPIKPLSLIHEAFNFSLLCMRLMLPSVLEIVLRPITVLCRLLCLLLMA